MCFHCNGKVEGISASIKNPIHKLIIQNTDVTSINVQTMEINTVQLNQRETDFFLYFFYFSTLPHMQ